jgi:hypothetical protein
MVDENSLSAARKTKFLARKKAIELYLKGATDAVLQKKTGEKRSNIYRIITNRCLQRHSDGDIFGWRGALPHFRVTAYERQTAPVVHENGAGATGALKWLLERPQFKDLKDRFHKRILNNADSLAHPKINVQTIFRWFIDELRKAGLEDQKAWPFNSESLGYESPRVSRRLHTLRRWSHEQEIKPFFTRSARTRCPHGARTPRRVPISLGHH